MVCLLCYQVNQVLNESLVKRIRTNWLKFHKGIDKTHNIAVLEGGLKWREINWTMKEMEFAELRRMNREEILAVFGVYESLLGLTANINNSILQEQKKMFWENTLLPKMEKLENALNMNLVWPYDESIYVAFDKDGIEALKGSQETRARISAMLADRGIMTINEIRQKYFNLSDVDWGNTWYMPLNLTPVEKAGQGLGTGTGGEGDRTPGRRIGRPAVDQQNSSTPKKELEFDIDLDSILELECKGNSQAQSFIFDKDKFTEDEARDWLDNHDKRSDKVDETDDNYRFRQFDPDKCSEGSFATIDITDGIQAVICTPKEES